jgi:hypothetical protein
MTQDKDQLETNFEQLVEKFKSLCDEVSPKIQSHLDKARKELDRAVELSEKHGIPFSAGVSLLGNNYMPRSFKKSEFKDLDEKVISDLTDVYIDGSYPGWEYSAVC